MQHAILLLTLVISFSSYSSNEAYMARLAQESLLLDIEANNTVVYAVGERGHVLRSTDGKNWQQMNVPTNVTLTAVTTFGDKVWAVGHDATIMHLDSPDGQWQIQMVDVELQKPLMDVLFFDQIHGIAIGAYGNFYRTRDGGKNWTKEMHPEFLHPDDQAYLQELKEEDEAFYEQELASILPHLNRISKAGDRLLLAGESGLLAYSDDLGVTWHRMESNYMGSFFDIQQTTDGRILAAGLRGNVFEYDAYEEQWVRIRSASKVSLNSIVSFPDGEIMIVGNNGNLVCVDGQETSLSQTAEGEAIVDAITYKDMLIGVSAVGITYLNEQFVIPTCKKVSS